MKELGESVPAAWLESEAKLETEELELLHNAFDEVRGMLSDHSSSVLEAVSSDSLSWLGCL